MSETALAVIAVAAVIGAGLGLILGGIMFARTLYSALGHPVGARSHRP